VRHARVHVGIVEPEFLVRIVVGVLAVRSDLRTPEAVRARAHLRRREPPVVLAVVQVRVADDPVAAGADPLEIVAKDIEAAAAVPHGRGPHAAVSGVRAGGCGSPGIRPAGAVGVGRGPGRAREDCLEALQGEHAVSPAHLRHGACGRACRQQGAYQCNHSQAERAEWRKCPPNSVVFRPGEQFETPNTESPKGGNEAAALEAPRGVRRHNLYEKNAPNSHGAEARL